MGRILASVAAVWILGVGSPALAQTRVEAVAPRIAPAGVAAVPPIFAQAPLSASPLTTLAAPSIGASFSAAPSPSAEFRAAPAAANSAPSAAVPALAPAAAVEASAEAPAPASAEQAHDAGSARWSLPKSEEGVAWKFRDLWFAGARLWDGARKAQEVGSGAMGTVFVHPSRPDSVVKVARRGYADTSGNYMASDEDALGFEDHDLARLADAGASPRPLARLTISGRPASERERIYGNTVARLHRAGLFGPREHALVHELLDRIAAGGLVARDLNFGNIMIGRRGADASERAWLVDLLGVSRRRDLDAAGRKAEMLADLVPWITFQGLGIGRPLGRMLDDALNRNRPLMPEDKNPLPWSKPRRYATLAAILGALAFLPPLVHAAMPAAPSALGSLPSWTSFAEVSVALAVAGIPLRLFAHRLAPWVRRTSTDKGVAIAREHPATAVPVLAIAALIEEAIWRGLGFIGGALLLMPILPHVAAFAVAALASSFFFALSHKYGSVWMRVVGGLIYAGAFIATGSLLLPIATHFAYNLSLYIWGRYLRP